MSVVPAEVIVCGSELSAATSLQITSTDSSESVHGMADMAAWELRQLIPATGLSATQLIDQGAGRAALACLGLVCAADASVVHSWTGTTQQPSVAMHTTSSHQQPLATISSHQ